MTELTDDAAHERRHEPDDDRYWNESWYLDFVSDDGTLGGYVRTGFYPNLDVCWYWACLVREGRPLVTVIDHEVPIPVGPSIGLRHGGLWADYVVEQAWERVSIGLEAQALEVADPTDTYGDLRGDPTPLGFELEWDTQGAPYPFPLDITRYEVPCRVEGEILVGDERIDFQGSGQRDHSWGVRDWWVMSHHWCQGALEDGTRFHGTHAMPGWGDWSIGYVQAPGGTPEGDFGIFSSEAEFDDDGLPTGARLSFPDLELSMEAVAHAPVLLTSPDGDLTRFPRSMVRYRADDGRTGVGWVEYGQPQKAPPAD